MSVRLLALSLLTLGCDPAPAPTGGTASLTASDQELVLTSVLVLDEVITAEDAWVQVRQGTCEAPAGSGNGTLLLRAGTHTDLPVELEALLPRPATGSTPNRCCVRLFDDVATPGVLTDEDQPLSDDDGPIAVELTGALTPGTPDLRMTFGAIGATDYELVAVEPTRFSFAVPATAPDLPLTVGLRYALVYPASHPLAIVGTPTGESAEEVLISASGGGTWDDDAGVDRDVTAGSTVFTATPELIAALADAHDDVSYLCEIHPSAMRGVITLP